MVCVFLCLIWLAHRGTCSRIRSFRSQASVDLIHPTVGFGFPPPPPHSFRLAGVGFVLFCVFCSVGSTRYVLAFFISVFFGLYYAAASIIARLASLFLLPISPGLGSVWFLFCVTFGWLLLGTFAQQVLRLVFLLLIGQLALGRVCFAMQLSFPSTISRDRFWCLWFFWFVCSVGILLVRRALAMLR